MPLTSRRFDAHLNRLQGHRRQPIARSGKFVRRAYSRRPLDCAFILSPIVRDVQRQRCWKRGSGDGQRLSLYDYGTTERSFLLLKGEVRRSPVQSARQPIARTVKFVRRAYSRRALDCEKDDGLTCMYAFSCMLSPIVIVEHTSV